jgi:outer membrane protein TolC
VTRHRRREVPERLSNRRDVERAYWELAAARANQVAAGKSVETARDALNITQVQYQVGVVSKVNVSQAEAGLAQREFEYIRLSNAASAAQDGLLTVILAPGISDYESTWIRTEEPTFVPYDVNAETALQKARELRPELAAAQLAVKNAEFDEKYAWTLPGTGYARPGVAPGIEPGGKPGQRRRLRRQPDVFRSRRKRTSASRAAGA